MEKVLKLLEAALCSNEGAANAKTLAVLHHLAHEVIALKKEKAAAKAKK